MGWAIGEFLAALAAVQLTRAADSQLLSAAAFSQSLGLDLGDVEPIQTNPYCSILRSTLAGEAVILKRYHEKHLALAADEAAALGAWGDYVRTRPGILPTSCLAFNPGDGTLAMEFVPGQRLTDAIRSAAKDARLRESLFASCEALGAALAGWYGANRGESSRAFDPHYEQYMVYLEKRLTGLGFGVGRLFRQIQRDTPELVRGLLECGDAPCRTHGDLVPRNIHVQDGRIGLIDLANSLRSGHPADDLWNFEFALAAMPVDGGVRRSVVSHLTGPTRQLGLSDEADRFFREYHRRRWLMLRLVSRSPKAWVDAVRGVMTFARANR